MKQGHLFGDKNPAGWIAVEEYDSEKLADDSEDEKKLRSTERRALSKLCGWKMQSRSTAQARFRSSQERPLSGPFTLPFSLFVQSNSVFSPFVSSLSSQTSAAHRQVL